MEDKRRCEVMKWQRAEGKQFSEKVFRDVATFHTWGVDYEEFENGPGMFTVAIVEFANGTVDMVRADMIRFI